MTINPLGGSGNNPDMNRRKTPPERAEEAAGHLRERIVRMQGKFKERMKKKTEAQEPPQPGKSVDAGHVFDSADLPDHEQNPPAPNEKRDGEELNEVG